MQSAKTRILIETVHKLMQTGADANLRRLLAKTHAADLALVFRSLSGTETREVFKLVSGLEERAELMGELDPDIQSRIVTRMGTEEAARLLGGMGADEAADLLGHLGEEFATAILADLQADESLEVEGLMGYAPDTAGGIMVTDYLSLEEDVSVEEAVRVIRGSDHVDMAFYVYAINEFGHLVGVISMRQLVTAPDATPLRVLMETNVLRVRPDTDQEEVARIVGRYNYLAVPVVDESNVLIGIVTIDDVIDVIREEATEDILKLAGAGEDLEEVRSIRRRVLNRVPSLSMLFLGGALAFAILSRYIALLQEHVLLVLVLPLVLGLSATSAVQASSFVIRGLSTGVLGGRWLRSQVVREVRVGLLLAALYSVLSLGLGYGLESPEAGVMLAIFTFCAMTVGSLVGTLLPLVLMRLRTDPIIATHPVVKALTYVLALALGMAVVSVWDIWISGG
jgi:magnesium transporter